MVFWGKISWSATLGPQNSDVQKYNYVSRTDFNIWLGNLACFLAGRFIYLFPGKLSADNSSYDNIYKTVTFQIKDPYSHSLIFFLGLTVTLQQGIYCIGKTVPILFIGMCNTQVPFVNISFLVSSRGWTTFSIKGQGVNILNSVGHIIFVATTQLCHCNIKVAADNI